MPRLSSNPNKMPLPTPQQFCETISALALEVPRTLLFALAEKLQNNTDLAGAKAIWLDCFAHHDRATSTASTTYAACWLAGDESAKIAWKKIVAEETYCTTSPEDRSDAIDQGLQLFCHSKPLATQSMECATNSLQHWFDYHGTLRNTWSLGVLLALQELLEGQAINQLRPSTQQLKELRTEALRGLRAVKTLEQTAFIGGAATQHNSLDAVKKSYEKRIAALNQCMDDIQHGFYPVQRKDSTSGERVLAYRFINLYLAIGIEPTEDRIGTLLGIGGLIHASSDRFRRMLEKLIREEKGTNPTLEIRRLFAAARNLSSFPTQ
ncbi:hypothetical protein N7373_02085 [Achromobacter mucicolens]|uniref:hypothetical protein n=1 Tax=Achromobacter mucicolens TaxID=1389922 RepID=UPI0024478F08|nr:hypothetical protein [Achromobacter mucicolens]MDH0090220.1 hypothetical protein [Achromobacter mucicolens]